MNDSSPNEPRFGEPPEGATRQVPTTDWNHPEIEELPVAPPPRERLFPRKVLIGWALLALVVYFGVKIVSTVVKESVKQAVTTAAQKSDSREIIYRTPNGRITISRNKPNGSITISRSQPETPATATPPTGTPPKGTPPKGTPPKGTPPKGTPPAPTKR